MTVNPVFTISGSTALVQNCGLRIFVPEVDWCSTTLVKNPNPLKRSHSLSRKNQTKSDISQLLFFKFQYLLITNYPHENQPVKRLAALSWKTIKPRINLFLWSLSSESFCTYPAEAFFFARASCRYKISASISWCLSKFISGNII